MRALSKIFAIGVVVISVAAGCGGSSDSAPGPLSKHFDDMYIAQIPLDQKQSIVQTQNDWSIAKMENAKAEADLNETSSQLSIVKNDHKAAKLAVDSAVAQKKSADASADNNKINAAVKDLHAAEANVKAAEARVKYFEAYRDFLKRQVRWTQENMYWREAQYELAKSQLAQKSNISPKGVQYDSFPSQEQERNKRAASSKQKVDGERQNAMSARDTWLKAQATANKETGESKQMSDPMATQTPPATAPAAATPAPAAAPAPAAPPAPAATPPAAPPAPTGAAGAAQ